MSVYAVVLLLTLAQINCLEAQEPILELLNGQVLGREDTTITGTKYYAFEKIPYATPPKGDLRFKAPQPVQNWDGILNTTTLDVSCYMLELLVNEPARQSENCLYINIYTPKLPSDKDTELLPVMFFIHGGGFVTGWSGYYQPDLFLDQGVIFISINYRVGAFGFLSTQDEVISGNYGLKLKLKLLALQWTHNNIHFFGGDPDRITIFGQDAGAGSCAYLLLNPNAQGLFSGAILQSGSAISPAMFQSNASEMAFGTASLLALIFKTNRDTQALYEFLMAQTAFILDYVSEWYYDDVSQYWDEIIDQGGVYAPVIEGDSSDAFITEKMYGLFQDGNALAVPVLMGFTSEENLFKIGTYSHDIETKPPMTEFLDKNLNLLVPYDMRLNDSEELTQMGERIREIYTGGEPFSDDFGAAVRYGSDQAYTRPMIRQAELFSKIAPTYFYQFSYDGELGNFNLIYDGAETVAHTEELYYLFCDGPFAPCNDTNYSESDMLTRQRLLKIWTDFAKFGNPTPEPSQLLQNLTWPQVSTENGDFLYVDIGENLEIRNHPKEEYYSNWVELYNSLGYDDFDTY